MNKLPEVPLSHNAIVGEDLITVLKNFQGMPHEELIKAFEQKLCEITSSPFAVALNSGTAAIHLALKISGVTKGDLVPVSTFTYVGSVNPIFYEGAYPVFIDSEEETWNMDPALLEDCMWFLSKQGKLPKAIIVVHAYGMPAKMNEIASIANQFGVHIIEDAAEALGATYFGKPVGCLGEIGVLSFNNNKTITSFGGGALLIKDKLTYGKVKFMATQAREQRPYYEHKEVGYNYRISPLNAAYGLMQLEQLPAKITGRRSVFGLYKSQLEPLGFNFSHEPSGFISSHWLSTVLLKPGVNPISIQARLMKKGIETRPLWNPMHCQPVFLNEMTYKNGVSERLFSQGLCLPSGENLSNVQIEKVIAELRKSTGYN